MEPPKPARTASLPRIGAILSLLTAALSGQIAPNGQETPSNETIVLPSFDVSETADRGYLAGNSVSATRINTAIANLPFAVSAFTPQFIADISARSLYDIAQYAAGVQNGSSAFLAGQTQFLIRGFNQYPEHDGFYESTKGNSIVDTFDIDRVEIVKGPASLLYGAISPGGTTNYITKKAEATPFIKVNGEWGSYNFGRVTIDVNQPIIGHTLLFRFNAVAENGYEDVVGTNMKTLGLAPTFTWNVSPRTSLRVSYQYLHREENPPAMPIPDMEVATPSSVVAGLYNPGYPGPSAALTGKTGIDAAEGYGSDSSNPGFLWFYPRWATNQNYSDPNDDNKNTLQSVDIEGDVTISNHWKARLNFNYAHAYATMVETGQSMFYLAPPNSLVYGNGAWSVSPAFSALSAAQQLAAELTFAQQILADPAAGLQLQNGTEAPAVQPRPPVFQWYTDNNITYQGEAVGEYDFSWGKIKPLAGIFYDTNRTFTTSPARSGNAASPYLRSWDVDPLSPTYYINKNAPWAVSSLTTNTGETMAWTSDQAAYGVLNASFFDDRIYFVGGARYNASQSQTTNYLAAAGTNPVGQGYKAHYTTPQGGIGYKVTKDVLLYASYSQSYQLPNPAYLNTIQTVNGVLKSVPTTQAVPVIGKGYEVGVKTNFLNGRISSTFSLYNIDEFNVVQSINSFIGGVSYATSVQNTEIASKGVELETTFSPYDNWQIFLSGSEDDARNVREPAGYSYYLGAYPAYFSKTLVNLWTRYTFNEGFLQGMWVGAGFNFVGKMEKDAVNPAAFNPPYTLYNAALGYDWVWHKKRLSAKVTGDNLKNVFYIPASHLRGLPRVFLLTLTLAL